MVLTKEQIAIINTDTDIIINAVAGSGKTHTLFKYAHSKHPESKILYLAFNRSVKEEAKKRFKSLDNVEIQTAHSLAYKNYFVKSDLKDISKSYKVIDIVDILPIKVSDQLLKYTLANHILRYSSLFCNSDKDHVKDIDYEATVSDKKAKTLVNNYLKLITHCTRKFLHAMNRGEIPITHDFYLKKYQLKRPKLDYEYILFDEGQDASPVMLDIFKRQKARKVIVGDSSQQIYGWRGAVDSLNKFNFKQYNLSKSFRFGKEIAAVSNKVLSLKNNSSIPKVQGTSNKEITYNKAILARTNVGLLSKAIETVMERDDIDRIYFEGDINSYIFASSGTSLYDVLNLYLGNRNRIKNKLIKSMTTFDDLKNYTENSDDKEIGMMIKIVREYGSKIPYLIKKLKEYHVPTEEKHTAQIIFSTVHKCKGMEYNIVQLKNDFITQTEYEKLNSESKAASEEEINLLYVAVSRATQRVILPEELLEDIEENDSVKLLYEESSEYSSGDYDNESTKKFTVRKVREKYPNAYKKWTDEEDERLRDMMESQLNIKEIAKDLGRKRGAITSRIKKLREEELMG